MSKRKIHIDLNDLTHKRLRVKTALQDISIQKFVETLINDAVADIQLEELKLEVEKKELMLSQEQ
jgi:hypothetical protein